MWFVVCGSADKMSKEGRENEAAVGALITYPAMQAGAEDLTFQALLTKQEVMTPFNQRWCTSTNGVWEAGSRAVKARLRQRESHDPSRL